MEKTPELPVDYDHGNVAEQCAAVAPDAVESHDVEDSTDNINVLLFLRHRWLIVRSAIAGFVLFAMIALAVPSRYESVAQLMPPDQSSPGLAAAVLGSAQSMGFNADLLGGKTPSALFIKILASQTVEDALVERFDLRQVYRVRYRENARKELQANTNITEDRKSGVVTIGVRDKDPRRAKEMCAAYVNELNRLSTQLSTSSARREREFLEQRLAVVKQELNDAAANLGQFSSKNATVDIPQQSKAMVESAASLQGQLIARESELQGLKQIYGEQNVRVRSLESSIAELRRNLHMLTGADSSASASAETPYPSLRKLPLLGVTYTDLLRRTKLSEAIFETLSKQYELAKVQEAKELPSVRLLDAPSYPEKKVSPPRLLIAIVGGSLGLIGGMVWVLWSIACQENVKRGLIVETCNAARSDFDMLVTCFRRSERKL